MNDESYEYFTRRKSAPILDSAMRVSMVNELSAVGVQDKALMFATDIELVKLHKDAFPCPFFNDLSLVAESLKTLSIYK